MKHQSDELKTTLKITQNELLQVKDELFRSEQLVNKMRSEFQMSRVGLYSGSNEENESKLT